MKIPRFLAPLALVIALAPVYAAKPGDAASLVGTVERLLAGRYDNSAQATAAAPAALPDMPHVIVTIERTPASGFELWHVHLETGPGSTFDQTWAMQARIEHDGSGALVPYYQLHQDAQPSAAAFDPSGWLSLEACALRGTFTATRADGLSEGEPCVAVSMSVGARRALLPVAFVRSGDALQLDFNLRNTRTRIETRRTP